MHRTKYLMFVAIVALAFSSVQRVSAEPRLEVPNDTCDFGAIPMSTTVTYSYWLKSTGSSPLEIEWVDASCPCGSMPLAAKVIQPGDSVAFELLLNSGRWATSYTQRPYIKTNADETPARLWYQAKVVTDPSTNEPLGMYPNRAELSRFGKYGSDTARIDLLNNSDAPISEITIDYNRPEYFDVILPNLPIAPRSKAKITVIAKNDAPEKSWEKSFTIETTFRPVGADNTKYRMTIPVRRKSAE